MRLSLWRLHPPLKPRTATRERHCFTEITHPRNKEENTTMKHGKFDRTKKEKKLSWETAGDGENEAKICGWRELIFLPGRGVRTPTERYALTPRQGAQVPRVDGRARSRAFGRPCLRDWRPMVGGGPRLLAAPRPCQSEVGATGDPRSGATLLVQTLVHSIVMLCCAGVRHVTAGAPWRFGD